MSESCSHLELGIMDCDIASYHVESFNYLAEEGLHLAALSVPKEKFRLPTGEAVEFGYTGASLSMPSLDLASTTKLGGTDQLRILPSECRQRGLTYAGNLKIKVNGQRMDVFETIIGKVPIMLKSNMCHLHKMSRKELIKAGEEGLEKGGYFICKGSEKVIRLLIANRRNFPIALVRKSFRDKVINVLRNRKKLIGYHEYCSKVMEILIRSLKYQGQLFTEFGVMMRSVKGNHTAIMMTIHYLETGTLQIALQYRREIFYIPFIYILKALTQKNDALIATELRRSFKLTICKRVMIYIKLEIIVNVLRKLPTTLSFNTEFLRALGNHQGGEITRGLEYFLATGNLITKIGLALQQACTDKHSLLPLFYLKAFELRGAFFMEMRTTDVRKLRPESWGFICPVHTPDGKTSIQKYIPFHRIDIYLITQNHFLFSFFLEIY
uniref:DNA-directed RNA polymerase n=1 Tax=Heterorhabditis bacteriophora TaxID=37862 RepID=A0A1I7WNY6_HETBA